MTVILGMTALTLVLCAGCAGEQGAAGPFVSGDHVRARLIAEHDRLVPGAVNHVAVVFEIDSGWHIYSPWRSDSGLPLTLELRGPEGFRCGEPLWPAPQRLISPGSILDHVYDNQVAIVLPLDVPPEVAAGRRVTLRCKAEWLVCGTSCIPGSGLLEIDLPVGVQGEPPDGERRPDPAWLTDYRRLVQTSLERVPVSPHGKAHQVAVHGDPGQWTIEVPGATGLMFYPAERCASLQDPLNDAISASGRLVLRLPAGATAGEPLVGVLEVEGPAGPDFFAIDISAGSKGGAADQRDSAAGTGGGAAGTGGRVAGTGGGAADQAAGVLSPAHTEDS